MITQIKAHMNTSSGVQCLWFQTSKKAVSCKFIKRKCAAFLLNTIQPQQIPTKICFLVAISASYPLVSEVQKKKPTKISFSQSFCVCQGMGFRGKLPPIFVSDPDPNIGFPLSPLMDFEQANKKEDLGKLARSFLLMQKKGSKYNRFTFNYTQQLKKYLSNKQDVDAGKKRFQESVSTQLPDKPQISPVFSQTFNAKFNYSNSQTSVAKNQLPPARQQGILAASGFLLQFWHVRYKEVKKRLCPFCVHPKFLVLFKTLPGC